MAKKPVVKTQLELDFFRESNASTPEAKLRSAQVICLQKTKLARSMAETITPTVSRTSFLADKIDELLARYK